MLRLLGTQYQNAALRAVPPSSGAFSSSITSSPCQRAKSAAGSPPPPPPTTTMSASASNEPADQSVVTGAALSRSATSLIAPPSGLQHRLERRPHDGLVLLALGARRAHAAGVLAVDGDRQAADLRRVAPAGGGRDRPGERDQVLGLLALGGARRPVRGGSPGLARRHLRGDPRGAVHAGDGDEMPAGVDDRECELQALAVGLLLGRLEQAAREREREHARERIGAATESRSST